MCRMRAYPAPVNGAAIAEWGCHDRHFGFHVQPPGRRPEIVERFGLHPVFGMDPYALRDFAPDDHAHRAGRLRTPAEHKALFDALIAGVGAKTKLAASVLAEEDWDLAVVVLGEGHAAGHQMWAQHEPAHPDHDAAVVAAIGGDPVAEVYRALDRPSATCSPDRSRRHVCLLFSHGMGRHHDGTHVLGEILKRLDDRLPAAAPRALRPRALRSGLQALQPVAERLGVAMRLPRRLRQALARKLGARPSARRPNGRARPFSSSPTTMSMAASASTGPAARPMAGSRKERRTRSPPARAGLARDRESRRPEGPLIRAVRRCDAFHRRRDEDSMPDLFIDWDRAAPIETVRSPLIGRVRAPYDGWRTGDHRPGGLLLARGPGLPAGRPCRASPWRICR